MAAWLDYTVPLVARFEGFRADRYIDPVGIPTIGYGETRKDIVARGRITEPFARRLLRRRLGEFARGVDQAITVPLTARQKAALTSFAYNVGVGALQESTLRRRLNAGDYQAVPGELAKWVNGGGRPLPGLVTRRRAEATMWRRGAPTLTLTERRRVARKDRPWIRRRVADLARGRTGRRRRPERRRILQRVLRRLTRR